MSLQARVIGHYEIVRAIASTPHSTVFLARHRDLGREDALKELSIFADGVSRQRFLDEAQLAARLSHHPNVVTVYDYFEAEESAWIAMDYFPRGTLAPYAGALSADQVTGVADSVLAALEEAQTRGIVHRDLKPQNLMVTAGGDTAVADFGIAKALDEERPRLTTEGKFMGTPVYAAPELALDKDATPAADLYSLAVVFHELLSGTWPFHDITSLEELKERKTRQDLPSLRGVRDLPDGVAAVIARLGRRDPTKRYASATEARAALRTAAEEAWGPGWRAAATLPPAHKPVPPPPPPPPSTRSRFGSYSSVTALAPSGRLLARAATRPFNLVAGLALVIAAAMWKPETIWVGAAAYVALVALSFFDIREAQRAAPPPPGRHARAR